jgi:hypothetical protein
MNPCACASPHICHCGNDSRWRIPPGYAAYGGWQSWNSNKENTPPTPHYPHTQTHPIPYAGLTTYPYSQGHTTQPIHQGLYLQPHPYPTSNMASSHTSVPFPTAPLRNNVNTATSSSTPTANAPKRKRTNVNGSISIQMSSIWIIKFIGGFSCKHSPRFTYAISSLDTLHPSTSTRAYKC